MTVMPSLTAFPGNANESTKARGPGGAHENMKAWEPEEDDAILQMHSKHGPRWSIIRAQQFPDRTVSSIRNRFHRIEKGRKLLEQGHVKNKCRACGESKRGHVCRARRSKLGTSHPDSADATAAPLAYCVPANMMGLPVLACGPFAPEMRQMGGSQPAGFGVLAPWPSSESSRESAPILTVATPSIGDGNVAVARLQPMQLERTPEQRFLELQEELKEAKAEIAKLKKEGKEGAKLAPLAKHPHGGHDLPPQRNDAGCGGVDQLAPPQLMRQQCFSASTSSRAAAPPLASPRPVVASAGGAAAG